MNKGDIQNMFKYADDVLCLMCHFNVLLNELFMLINLTFEIRFVDLKKKYICTILMLDLTLFFTIAKIQIRFEKIVEIFRPFSLSCKHQTPFSTLHLHSQNLRFLCQNQTVTSKQLCLCSESNTVLTSHTQQSR